MIAIVVPFLNKSSSTLLLQVPSLVNITIPSKVDDSNSGFPGDTIPRKIQR